MSSRWSRCSRSYSACISALVFISLPLVVVVTEPLGVAPLSGRVPASEVAAVMPGVQLTTPSIPLQGLGIERRRSPVLLLGLGLALPLVAFQRHVAALPLL